MIRPSPNISAVFKRFNSSVTKPGIYPINHNQIYVIALPITTHKSYIYCNHRPSILDKSQLKTYPVITKLETKATGLALKAWNKIKTSDNKINIKITQLVQYLLNTIPYEENCLTSFPSKNSMIREVNEEFLKANYDEKSNTEYSTLVQSKITDLNIPPNQLKPIPIYYPNFQQPSSILKQLYLFRDDSYAKHLKYSILCGIGVPLSLPLALIPVVPNVPGLYLAYRFYCNVKSLLGAKHLSYLLEPNNNGSVSDTKHLVFSANQNIDKIYALHNSTIELSENSGQQQSFNEETLLITPEIIESLVKELGFDHIEDQLKKALQQESQRLHTNLKVDDEVE